MWIKDPKPMVDKPSAALSAKRVKYILTVLLVGTSRLSLVITDRSLLGVVPAKAFPAGFWYRSDHGYVWFSSILCNSLEEPPVIA